jgi:hypothetical protein
MEEWRPDIFRGVSNDVDAIEEWTEVCGPLGRLTTQCHHVDGGVLGHCHCDWQEGADRYPK